MVAATLRSQVLEGPGKADLQGLALQLLALVFWRPDCRIKNQKDITKKRETNPWKSSVEIRHHSATIRICDAAYHQALFKFVDQLCVISRLQRPATRGMNASGNTNNTITYIDLTTETNLSRWAAYCFILDPSSFPNWKALSRFIYMWMMTAIYLCKFSNFNYQSRAAFWHRAGNWAKNLAQSPARCIWFQIRTSKKRKFLTTRNKIKTITKRSKFACKFLPPL